MVESLWTLLTLIGSLIGVFIAHMSLQLGFVVERGLAKVTLDLLLQHVIVLEVPLKELFAFKGLVTKVTLEWMLLEMDGDDVLLETRLITKPHVTNMTFVSLKLGVNGFMMSFKVTITFKDLRTLGTDEIYSFDLFFLLWTLLGLLHDHLWATDQKRNRKRSSADDQTG